MEKIEIKNEIEIINETNIKDLIYEIRGQRVMLDFDLARIYGYETKVFNRQVKRNIEKFDEDFMFQISKAEFEYLLRCQNVTLKSGLNDKGRHTYLPYAFTEQGIYMLMTVLKGELAIKQSKALIRVFKKMSDFINESNKLLDINEILRLSNQVNQNSSDIEKIKKNNKEIKVSLKTIMENFNDPKKFKHKLIMDGERIEADIAYQRIYSLATSSIIIIDDYIDIKTFELLKICSPNISITICSDNKAKNTLSQEYLNDFFKDTGIMISLRPTNGLVHDRYIVIDYKTSNYTLFSSGASLKDSGNRATTIQKVGEKDVYIPLIDKLLI